MEKYFSNYAKKLLNTEFKNNTILYKNEVLTHDGYDDFGPESNIYDLYLVVKNDKNQIDYYHYNMENWFNQDENTLNYILLKKIQS